jgi:hypothetical protein
MKVVVAGYGSRAISASTRPRRSPADNGQAGKSAACQAPPPFQTANGTDGFAWRFSIFISDLFGRVPAMRFGLAAFGTGSVLANWSSVEPEHGGIASAVQNAAGRLPALIATACGGLIAASTLADASFARLLQVCAALFFIAAGTISNPPVPAEPVPCEVAALCRDRHDAHPQLRHCSPLAAEINFRIHRLTLASPGQNGGQIHMFRHGLNAPRALHKSCNRGCAPAYRNEYLRILACPTQGRWSWRKTPLLLFGLAHIRGQPRIECQTRRA